MRRRVPGAVLLGLCMAFGATAVRAAPLAAFFGRYIGVAVSSANDEIAPRDISVDIEPAGAHGFRLRWTTLIRKRDGELKRSRDSVRFVPSRLPGVYASAMRRDLFGQERPLNPLAGEPFVWATLRGDTLTVYELIISDTGGYEMQSYARTLEDDGLVLRFKRVRDGVPERLVTGKLRRIGAAR